MLVTSDPLAEIDAALAGTVQALHAARSRNDSQVVDRLTVWIDHRLDERCEFDGDRCGRDESRGDRDRD